MLKVLDLFSGTGGWSQAFLDRGHGVIRVDNDEQFLDVPWTSMMDVMEDELNFLAYDYRPDVILASPPCQPFSLAAISKNFDAIATCRNCQKELLHVASEQWHHHVPDDGCMDAKPIKGTLKIYPASEKAEMGIRLVDRTLELINHCKPKYWWVENPRGGMMHFMPLAPTTVWYCQYGDVAAKPTHLWGDWPTTWKPRPPCHNGNPKCHHERASRGSKTGTQGKKGAVERAAVPYALSLDVCKAVEKALAQ